jgi:hypothetical protein
MNVSKIKIYLDIHIRDSRGSTKKRKTKNPWETAKPDEPAKEVKNEKYLAS